jgi:hypothetical protein
MASKSMERREVMGLRSSRRVKNGEKIEAKPTFTEKCLSESECKDAPHPMEELK